MGNCGENMPKIALVDQVGQKICFDLFCCIEKRRYASIDRLELGLVIPVDSSKGAHVVHMATVTSKERRIKKDPPKECGYHSWILGPLGCIFLPTTRLRRGKELLYLNNAHTKRISEY